MSLLNILHVSDVHFREGGNADQVRVAEALLNAAHHHTGNLGYPPPNICIFSGDLADSGSIAEFRKAELWLHRLISPWRCELFIVPGNHDVTRPRPNNAGNRLIRNLQDASFSPRNYGRYQDEVRRSQSNL